MVFPWVTFNYTEMCSGAPMVFTMRKFIEDPALISLLSSLNIFFNFAVGTVTSYMSDRIWTRWGRRRPFLIVGWTGLALALVLLPLANSTASLVAIIIFYQLCQDIAKPYEPLFNEVIPPPQRGRAGMLRNLTQNLTGIFFNAVLLAQFDRDYGLDRIGGLVEINGERLLYWTVSLLLLLTVLFLLFGVRESVPSSRAATSRFSFSEFLRDVFGARQWWMVYLLYACPIIASAGAAGGSNTFLPLFQSEQLHFSKEQIGWSTGAVMLLNTVLFVPIAGFLSDRWSRLRLFQIGLIGQGLVVFVFFLYSRYVANYSMSLLTATVFVAANNAFVFLVYVLWGPLLYDYIPSNRFGTVSAGFSFAGGLAGFLVINASGLWVKGFSALFGTAGTRTADYSSAFVLQFLAGVTALLIAIYFEREVKRGRVQPYGVIEFSTSNSIAQGRGDASGHGKEP
jgi:Na+/melibiose symporter-like transporter